MPTTLLPPTRDEMIAHLNADDAAVRAEVDRVNALPDGAIPNADLLGFSHFLDAYHAFSTAARRRANTNIVIRGETLGDDDAQLIVYERQLREWQDHCAKIGHPATSPIVPRDSVDHPLNEPATNPLGGLADAFTPSPTTKLIVGIVAAAALVYAIKH